MSLLLAPHYAGGGAAALGEFQDGFDVSAFGLHFAYAELHGDGTLWKRPFLTQVGNWLIGGDASLYELRATYVGDDPSGILNTWINAGGGISFGITQDMETDISLEFRLASDKSHVGSGTMSLSTGG